MANGSDSAGGGGRKAVTPAKKRNAKKDRKKERKAKAEGRWDSVYGEMPF